MIYTSVFKWLQFDVNNTKLFVTFEEASTTGINQTLINQVNN